MHYTNAGLCHTFFFILIYSIGNSADTTDQRWSPRGRPWPQGRPRGHILKSLALALASKPQVLGLEALGPPKLPFLGLRTARFLNR